MQSEKLHGQVSTNNSGTVRFGMGRGGGIINGAFTHKDEDSLGVKVNESIERNYFFLDLNTTIADICGWPAQALVQVLLKIDESEFGIEKENLTHYNPKLLRRLVIEMRDDLRDAKKLLQIDTTIRNNMGVFSINTKSWELEAYDEEELKLILEKHLSLENLEDEKSKVQDMMGEDIRKVLFGLQQKMLDAEISPFNIHVQFEYYRGTIQEGVETWGNVIYESDEMSQDEIKAADSGNDSDEASHKPFEELEYIKLNKHTNLEVLRQWSGYVNISFLMEWYEQQKIDFDEDFFQTLNSTTLRYQVWTLAMSMKDDSKGIMIAVHKNEKHTISKATRDWELLALDKNDLTILYRRFQKMQNKKVMAVTQDEMYKELMETNELMNSNDIHETMYSGSLNVDFQGCELYIPLVDEINNQEALLNMSTTENEISK